MHYLQGHFDSALGSLTSVLVPSHKYMSVHDFFNPELFHACLLRIIADIPELASHAETLSLPVLLREGESVQGYVEQRVSNFATICEVMAEASEALGLVGYRPSKEVLFALVRHGDLDELQGLLQRLFELVIRNHRLLEFITTLPEQHQFAIHNFIQRAKDRQDAHTQEELARNDRDHERERLEEQNTELRQLLAARETELEQVQHQARELEEQVAELRELQLAKEAHIDGLKRRLIAYEETDSLFQEKDEEIFRLQRQLADLQIAHRLLANDLKSEKDKLEGRIGQLERINAQLQAKSDRLYTNCELLTRQRQDIQSSNKRVIANLRDRIKSLTDRTGQLQDQLVEARIGRELREREFSELMTNFEALKSQVSEPLPRPREHSLDPLLNSSAGHPRQLLEEELNEVGRLKENAFEEEIRMFDSGEDNLKRVQEIIAENARLKERVTALEARGGRQGREENEKWRKKFAVMKKRNEELEMHQREELQLLISAFDELTRLTRE